MNVLSSVAVVPVSEPKCAGPAAPLAAAITTIDVSSSFPVSIDALLAVGPAGVRFDHGASVRLNSWHTSSDLAKL